MILTGNAITEAVASGDIVIRPFSERRVNPNSYNYSLGEVMYTVSPGDERVSRRRLELDGGRYLLRKRNLYLGVTHEVIGSRTFVTSLIGRSSIGRLGLFVQVSANLGHVGAIHRWTLEIVPVQDIYVYPGQIFGQVSFWECHGRVAMYRGWFGQHDVPMPSKHHDKRFANAD